MARKLKIMENEKHPLDDLKNEKSLKYVKNEKCTLKDLEYGRQTDRQPDRQAEKKKCAGQPATIRTRGQVSAWLGRRPQPQQQRSPPGFRDFRGT